MKYHIISINDDRITTKNMIRERVGDLEAADVESFNAYENDAVKFLSGEGINLRPELWIPKVGEVGIWSSIVNCWNWCVENNEELLVFEDDARPIEGFRGEFDAFYGRLPKDYDFAAIWVPENQRNDYHGSVIYDEHGCPQPVPRYLIMDPGVESMYELSGRYPVVQVYQGYGGVSMLFSPKGSKEFLKISRKFGIYTPVDCHFYLSAHRPEDNVAGYAPHPGYLMVEYDWGTPTTIQTSERIQ